MTTPTTPEQARNIANSMFSTDPAADALRTLAQQVEELTKERDALRVIIVDSVAALGTSASVSQTSRIEFLQSVPGEIRTTVDALKADAERYRHLRDAENEGDYSIGEATDFCDGGWERVTWRYRADLDASIDSAMKAAS